MCFLVCRPSGEQLLATRHARRTPACAFTSLVFTVHDPLSSFCSRTPVSQKVKDRDGRLLRAKELLQSKLASKDQELEAALVGRVKGCACCHPPRGAGAG